MSRSTLPKKGLKIAHLNICSLRNKVQEIENILTADCIHILAISETHLDQTFNDATVDIPGYRIHRKDRDMHGGGVAIYIQSHIPVKLRLDLMSCDVEMLWLQVHLPHLKPVLVGCCYRPPSSSSQYLDKLCDMVERACDENREIYILGDLNINFMVPSCPLKKKIDNTISVCNLVQVVKQPTRVFINKTGCTSATCIDHIYTNCIELCSKAISVPVGFSDHNLVAISRKAKVPKAGPKIVYKRSYRGFSCDSYVNEVNNICWSSVSKQCDPDTALDAFTELLVPVMNKHAPIRKVTVRATRCPWIDDELKQCMSERKEAKETANKSGCMSDWQVYSKLRNYTTKLNRKKKKLYYESRLNDIKHDGKKLWSTLNDIMGRNSSPTPSFIEVEGSFITKPVEIANYFNDYFMNKVCKLRQEMSSPNDESLYSCIQNKIMHDKNCNFEFCEVTVEEVKKLIMSIHNEKPPGIDNLDGKLLKIVADHIAIPVSHIFNQSLNSNRFPQVWKEAKVIPLPKNPRAAFTGSNSRPISLLPVLSKLLEKIVFNQIQSYFALNNLTSNYQHAYREGHSTSTALTQMTDDWQTDIDQQNMIGAVLLDFSAAFDVIDHSILLNKLRCYGFATSAIAWIESYLTKRTQKVFFNGCLSNAQQMQCGIPQGSSLGPLLFSIFTNDLPQVCKSACVCMYADDSTLYKSAQTMAEITSVLNKELQLVYEWITNNKMVLNISKTKSIVFGTKYSLRSKPQLNLSLNNVAVEQVQEIKLLGVTLDSILSWSEHIDLLVQKMGRNISVVRRCSPFLTPQLTKQVLQTLVLSHLDYCSVVWSGTTKTNLQKLQRVQNRAARLALKCTQRANTDVLHNQLSWLKVDKRLKVSLLSFIKHINTFSKPDSLFERLTLSSTLHTYPTRHANNGNYTIPTIKTNSKQRTVLCRAMVEWNSLPEHILKTQSKVSFKRQIKQHFMVNCT